MKKEKLNEKDLKKVIGGENFLVLVAVNSILGGGAAPGSGIGGGPQIRAFRGISPRNYRRGR